MKNFSLLLRGHAKRLRGNAIVLRSLVIFAFPCKLFWEGNTLRGHDDFVRERKDCGGTQRLRENTKIAKKRNTFRSLAKILRSLDRKR